MLLVGIAVGLPGVTVCYYNTCTSDLFSLSLFIEVTPVYILAFFFVLQLYVCPHKYNIQNIIEAVILLDYCILLILRHPQSLLESLNPSYYGTLVPDDNGSQLPPKDFITLFFLPFFYLPVVIGVGIFAVWLVYKIW